MELENCTSYVVKNFINKCYVNRKLFHIKNISYLLYGDYYESWFEKHKEHTVGDFLKHTDYISEILAHENIYGPLLFPTGFLKEKRSFTNDKKLICYRTNETELYNEKNHPLYETDTVFVEMFSPKNDTEMYRIAFRILNCMINNMSVNTDMSKVLSFYTYNLQNMVRNDNDIELTRNLVGCVDFFSFRNVLEGLARGSTECAGDSRSKCDLIKLSTNSIYSIYGSYINLSTESKPLSAVFPNFCITEILYTISIFDEYNNYKIVYDETNNTVSLKQNNSHDNSFNEEDHDDDDENDDDNNSNGGHLLDSQDMHILYNNTLIYNGDYNSYLCSVIMFEYTLVNVLESIRLLKASTNIIENCYHSTIVEFYTNVNCKAMEKYNVVSAMVFGSDQLQTFRCNKTMYNKSSVFVMFRNIMSLLVKYVTLNNITKVNIDVGRMSSVYEFLLYYVSKQIEMASDIDLFRFIISFVDRIDNYMILECVYALININAFKIQKQIECNNSACPIENNSKEGCHQNCFVQDASDVYEYLVDLNNVENLKASDIRPVINYALINKKFKIIKYLKMYDLC